MAELIANTNEKNPRHSSITTNIKGNQKLKFCTRQEFTFNISINNSYSIIIQAGSNCYETSNQNNFHNL